MSPSRVRVIRTTLVVWAILAPGVAAQEAERSPAFAILGDPAVAPPDAQAVRAIVEAHLKEADAKKKADEDKAKRAAEAQGYAVGSSTGLTATWTPGGVVFQSQHGDFRAHVGGRFQMDSVWWAQPQALRGPPPGPGGVPAQGAGGGVGPLEDGVFFRRLRLKMDGAAYEVVEFDMEFDFENLNRVTFDNMFAGVTKVPLLGTVRVGHQKVPQGMEAVASYRFVTMMERSAVFDTFWQLFAPGVLVANNYFDQRLTVATMFHRVETFQQFNGADFGDGDYAQTTRVTFLPHYAANGARLLHLGGSYQWRRADVGRSWGSTGNAFADAQHVARFRGRPELRDATGAGADTQGNAARFIDTGFLLADNVHTAAGELMWVNGPLSVTSEATFAVTENARSIFPAADFGTPRGNPAFWGGYVQVSYFLTGEHYGYDRRWGVFDRPLVNENFFAVRGENGRVHCGWGAWELAYRFSYVDLNDSGINGGLLREHTLGVNWYLNNNLRVMVNYLNADRAVDASAASGTVHGFGIRAFWEF